MRATGKRSRRSIIISVNDGHTPILACTESEKKVSTTPEEEREAAQGYGLCARFLKTHGFAYTAALYDKANAVCELKAHLLEEIERNTDDLKQAIQRSGES